MNYSNREIFSTLDLDDFSWLPLWKQDQKLRAKIDKCQKEIEKIRSSPFSQEEVKEQFERVRNIFRERRLEIIDLEARNIQTPNIPLTGGVIITPFYQRLSMQEKSEAPLTGLMSCFSIFEIPGVWKEIEQVIAGLPKGASQKEKKQFIAKVEAEIDGFYKEINEKLSPRKRWIHDKVGNPKPYPRGCRWKRYVDVLNVMLPYFERLADVDNKPLNAKATNHFKECGFDKLVGTANVSRLFKLREQVRVTMAVNLDC